MGLFDFFKKNKSEKEEKLDKSLEKTKSNLFTRISKAVLGKSKIDDDVLDELEESLLLSDVGVDTTVKIINNLRERVARDKYTSISELEDLLRDEIAALMIQNTATFELENVKTPYVMMVVGVNGVGKTTTIGKLAWQFKQAGNQVVLGAADTFRAAAVDQLRIWSQRVDVPLIEKGMGVDPAAVAFEAVRYAVENNADVVIIDTAGRLHNKKNLMNELAKIRRSIAKTIPDAPHEVLLVLDASTGQNAIMQAEEFINFTEVTALALTKLDGTAKGGVVVGISDRFKIPVKYIGIGEGMEDLQIFDPQNFVETLFKKKSITTE
ncbi:MAG: signal recognition particle-docking protein FtsY [Bacteroidia bacterium]|nr:signal recognition particle-docking protein FtsY [Bacteroidia bacterium]MDW8158110.1 signal recognition particle-docking protein FtsY [Bacteroidia bacterium]